VRGGLQDSGQSDREARPSSTGGVWVAQQCRRLTSSRLFRDAGLYFGFKLTDRAVPLLLLPVVARALGAEQYGTFVLFQSLAGLTLPLMTLSVDGSILLNYFKVSQRAFPAYFSSGYRMILGSSAVVAVSAWLLRDWLGGVADFPAQWIVLIVSYCFLQFHTRVALNLYQVRRQPVRYGIFSLSLTLLKNGGMLILVLGYDWGWEGVALGYTGAQAIMAAVGLVIFARGGLLQARVRRAFVRDNVRVGYPLSVHQMGAWGASSATRVIVAGVLGSASAGSFGVGAAIAMLVMFMQDAFNKAYVPYLFDRLIKLTPAGDRQLVLLTYAYVAALLSFSLAYGIAGALFVEPLFGIEFREAAVVVPLLSLAFGFQGAYKMHVNYIFFAKQTHLILMITVTTGVANILLSLALVRSHGLAGSAISLLITNILGYLLAWYIGQKVYPMNWSLRR